MEYIDDFIKQQYIEERKNLIAEKIIVKEPIVDVYSVMNKASGCKEGILYVKGIEDSRKIKAVFNGKHEICITCVYNNTFKKWQPQF